MIIFLSTTFASCKETLHSYSQDAKVVNKNSTMWNVGWIILLNRSMYQVICGSWIKHWNHANHMKNKQNKKKHQMLSFQSFG